MIRVLLADDQALVRSGFRALLGSQPDLDVVAEAADGAQAVAAVRDHHPDVVLMDIRMPGTDGITATREITDDSYVFDAIRGGASGFLVKDSEPADLIHAIRVVHGGEALLAPAVTRTLIAEFAARSRGGPDGAVRLDELTDREREVLAEVAAGLSTTRSPPACT